MNKTILVCGGRDFTDKQLLFDTLDKHTKKGDTIVHGAARGADLLADSYAKERGLRVLSFPVTSDDWNSYGRYAGIRRNELMLANTTPDLVIAFPGGRGTAHMRNHARKEGYTVINVVN